jgi:hypothetical protein
VRVRLSFNVQHRHCETLQIDCHLARKWQIACIEALNLIDRCAGILGMKILTCPSDNMNRMQMAV